MKNRSLLWFLFGLGGQLQIIASLSFTELFVFVTAPFLFSREYGYMKRNGVMPFFYVSLALVLGCIIACISNKTEPIFALRGLAVCCLMPCSIVVMHWMLRNNMHGLKWSFVGGALSGFLSTFIFQKSVEVVMLGNSAKEIMSGATYWIHRLGALVIIPAKGWYLSCPILYSIGAPLFMAGFSLLTSTSGRGSAARAIASAVLVLIGGKKRLNIKRRICRNFYFILIIGLLGAFAVKHGYQLSASSGWLGEAAMEKYEKQTKGDKSLKALLLGGRMESFCGLLACVDKPIVGFGPWAFDTNGYQEEFLSRYANEEDYRSYMKNVVYSRTGGSSSLRLIPCHSVVTQLWLWYGIAGLIFCMYIFYVILRYLKQDCWCVPQWFFWLAASTPGVLWNMFFNPLSSRVGLCLLVVACLMVRAVRKGRQELPYCMIEEIQKSESK